jgi:predicted phosphodiesterase
MRSSKLLLLVALLVSTAFAQSGAAFQQPANAPAPPTNGAAAAPADAEAAPASLRFVVVGDTGTGDADQYAVAKQMLAEHDRSPYKIVVHVGDIIYGKGFSEIKKVFDEPYRPLIERDVKFHATLGNHDQDNPRELSGYAMLGMGGKLNYSFKPAGDLVEFFTFDSTLVLKGRAGDQLDWLDKQLGESKARWKIVFFHHPPYSTGKRHGDDATLIEHVVPILKKHNVRVVITGHEHFFARLKPVDGINYIISGSGGKIHRGGLQYDGRLVYGNDQVHQFMSATLTRDAFEYTVIGSNGETLFRESIPFQ